MPKDLTGDPEDLDELSEDTKAHEASIASVSKADRFPTLVPPEPEPEKPWFTRFNHFVGQLEFQRPSRLKVLGLVAKCLIATAIITVLILIYLFGRNLPNQQSLLEYRPALTTQVVARDGQVRDEFALLRRT